MWAWEILKAMKLHIEWMRPITLSGGVDKQFIYWFDVNRLPGAAGIYVFGRRFGTQFNALYVGKAGNLRSRAKGQLNNLRLMQHIKNARNGKREILVGRFIPKPGQQENKCLGILERALIRYFLSEGHDLVNKQGTRLRRHEITSIRSRKNVPKLMFVDRGKGE